MIFHLILSQSLPAVLHQLEDFGMEAFVLCHIKLVFVMLTVLVVNENELIFRLTQPCSWGLRFSGLWNRVTEWLVSDMLGQRDGLTTKGRNLREETSGTSHPLAKVSHPWTDTETQEFLRFVRLFCIDWLMTLTCLTGWLGIVQGSGRSLCPRNITVIAWKDKSKTRIVYFKVIISQISTRDIPYPTAFPYGNGMVLHFYQQQESSTTKTVHKVINKGLKAYV